MVLLQLCWSPSCVHVFDSFRLSRLLFFSSRLFDSVGEFSFLEWECSHVKLISVVVVLELGRYMQVYYGCGMIFSDCYGCLILLKIVNELLPAEDGLVC